jgi:flagellar hook-length control protein FliK
LSSNGLPAATIGAASNAGNNGAGGANALLGTLLAESLAVDPKATPPAAGSNGGPSTATPPAPTAVAATAALTAAQLIAPPHVGSAQASDRSTMALSSPVGSSAWTDELGAKVTWMTHQGIESASLQLSPEHLGPLQVTISVHDGQASVWFGAAQADTRTALQQSLPQLRQLFASQGLSLTDTGVSREPPRGQSRQQASRTAAPVASISAVNSDGSASRISVAGLNLLDTYA